MAACCYPGVPISCGERVRDPEVERDASGKPAITRSQPRAEFGRRRDDRNRLEQRIGDERRHHRGFAIAPERAQARTEFAESVEREHAAVTGGRGKAGDLLRISRQAGPAIHLWVASS